MGKKRTMLPVEEVDVSAVKYRPEPIQAPRLTGLTLRLFVWMIEAPLLGLLITSFLKRQNRINQLLRDTVIPEKPMFRPEFPPQDREPGVVILDEERDPTFRLESALECLPPYDPSNHWNTNSPSFLYWTIRDFAHAYRSQITSPSAVAEQIILALEGNDNRNPPMPFLVSFSAEEVRKQAAASTQRLSEGNPLSILDGIFMAIKDDIDCLPHPTKGATLWLHKVRTVKQDAVCVARLRSCGVIFIGKANMHELGLGTTGNNPNYGTPRNPHSNERYTGGSSSGPAALVASGLCSATLGTDGGGSIRIPSSLCGVVGLKTTFGRTDMKGVLCDCGTVEVVSPIAATIEDIMLVYAAMSGSSPDDKISLNPSPICLPNLSAPDNVDVLQSTRLGKYSEWFSDVRCIDIANRCEDVLVQLSDTCGCKIVEIILPELQEMRTSHVVSIGSESLCSLSPDCEDGRGTELTLDTRISLALFRSFSAADYVAAQRLRSGWPSWPSKPLIKERNWFEEIVKINFVNFHRFYHWSKRRRIMHHYMEVFKQVDIIVTPTTGITAPKIPTSSLQSGESDYEVSGYLMRYVIAGNLLGLPAISVPVGHDSHGLPIGMQLIGRPWAEATLLRVASAIEDLCSKSRLRPCTFYDVLNSI